MSSCLDDLSQAGVDALDGVGGVEDASDFGREGEEGNDFVPDSSPGGSDGGKFLAPSSLSKGLELLFGHLGIDRGVDGLESRCQLLAILPGGIAEAAADQVDDAGL